MINLYNELKNFAPIDLEGILKTNPEISEDYRISITLYNNALENLRTGSEDIAIIELKKAVAMNRDFHEAVNLLGICFYYMKAYEKAEEMFKIVAEAESNGVRAFNYLKIIDNNDNDDNEVSNGIGNDTNSRSNSSGSNSENKNMAKRTRISRKKKTRSSAPISAEPKISTPKNPQEFSLRVGSDRSRWDGVVKYATGIIIGLIIAFIVGIPSIFSNDTGNKKQTETLNNDIIVLTDKLQEVQNKNSQLSRENESLKKELEKEQIDAEYYKSVGQLSSAEELFEKNKFEEAADVLTTIKNVEFASPEKERYNNISNNVMKRASDIVYSQAYNLFQAGKFTQALEKYTKIPKYTDEYGKMDIVLYYIGKSYLELNDNKNASVAFQEVIERFPDSEYARYSKSRLSSIAE